MEWRTEEEEVKKEQQVKNYDTESEKGEKNWKKEYERKMTRTIEK